MHNHGAARLPSHEGPPATPPQSCRSPNPIPRQPLMCNFAFCRILCNWKDPVWSVCVCFLSDSDPLLRLIHVISYSFYSEGYSHHLDIPWLVHSPIGGHLDPFQVGADIKNASTDIGVQGFVWAQIFIYLV